MSKRWFRPSSWILALAVVALATGPAACGGGDESSPASDAGSSTEATSDPAPNGASSGESASDVTAQGATFEDALACLKAEGIDARDQSNSISGSVIGIDYSGGRTTIEFEDSRADADTTASIAESYGEVIQAGTVVASIDPSGSSDAAAVESCITG
jgi:hypothetical protein